MCDSIVYFIQGNLLPRHDCPQVEPQIIYVHLWLNNNIETVPSVSHRPHNLASYLVMCDINIGMYNYLLYIVLAFFVCP